MTPMSCIQLHLGIGLPIRYTVYQMPDGWKL